MKISYNWLKQFINLDWKAEQTAILLTDLGLEIEGIDTYESIKGGLQGIVVGQVLSCEAHPNADRLKLTKVEIGTGTPIPIVCGAPNVGTGQKVAVATIDTKLYTEEGKEWTIKKGKIRGEESYGMLCGESEIGLGTYKDGIMVLDKDIPVGTPLSDIFPVENDDIFEIGLTPNRSDAMSHWGTARDLKAGLLQQDIKIELITPSVSNFNVDTRTHKIDIKIQDPAAVPRYCGLTISDITVSESPAWIQNRLLALGLTPKNNIVDITNYVLHELGQPLHAFDAEKIEGSTIAVQTVAKGTKFTTLDGIERTLHEDDLMICDQKKPLCIAGVFGGLDSGVTEKTTTIFLESAYFNPVRVRKAAKRHGLNTDASFRFERGINPNTVEYALKRAALLIKELAGGVITSNIIDLYPKKIEDFQVFLSFENTKKLIGEEIPRDTIKKILTSLEIKVNSVTESGLGLSIPPYRNDVQREADVIEEILRVYGYNNIQFSTKLSASISTVDPLSDHNLQNTIATQLVSQGFYEILSNSLTTNTYTALSENISEDANITILNALSNDLSVLRQSMLFSGLETISHNFNRKQSDLNVFEFGKTYHNQTVREEKKHLSILMTGNKTQEHWNTTAATRDFFHLKGIVIAVLERLGHTNLQTIPVSNDVFSEGLCLEANKVALVEFGIVNASILKHFSIPQEVAYADFNWDAIIALAKSRTIKIKEIPKFPEVRRDFALLLDTTTTFKEIHTIATQTEKQLLTGVNLFDVYEGNKLPEGKKSYAVSFTLQDHKKTLTDKQVDKIMNKLKSNFETKLGATLR